MPKGLKGFQKGHEDFISIQKRRIIGRLSGKKNKGKKYSEEQNELNRLAHLGHKHSEETKKKMSESHKGEKCYWWQGGITPENHKIRTSLEYKLWRKAVFERDDYRCMDCGIRNGEIEADHILQFSKYPQLRFVLENGQVLCKSCHKAKTRFERTGKMSLNMI